MNATDFAKYNLLRDIQLNISGSVFVTLCGLEKFQNNL